MIAWVRRGLARFGHLFWRPWLRRRLGKMVIETIEDVPLVVLPEVFNPGVFRTSTPLVRALRALPEASAGQRALDLGTGSGVGAVFAARAGFRVDAVDVNPQAVRCARANAVLHALDESITVHEGDLFAPVAGHRFDLVLFNPPYFRGSPRSRLDAAWRGQGVLERFARQLPEVLTPAGRALVVLSTDGVCDNLLDSAREQGLGCEEVSRQTYGTEAITVWCIESAGRRT